MSVQRHTLVLLHPFPQDASFWDATRAHLDPAIPVIAPQFPGFGGTVVSDEPDIAAFAAEIAATIAATESGCAVVGGLSMGGYVALALAANFPDQVSGLILANTRAGADSAEARSGRDAGIAAIRRDGIAAYLDGFLPKLTAPDVAPSVAARARAIADAQTPDAIIGALQAMRDRPDRVDALATITAPTAVVQGTEDGLIPVASIDQLVDGIPSAERHVIGGAGHLTALEAPEAFAAVVASVLARVAA